LEEVPGLLNGRKRKGRLAKVEESRQGFDDVGSSDFSPILDD
jgi:hypothetical protein